MRQYSLLIVEDDAFIVDDLSTILDWQAAGYDVLTAANGKQGLGMFELHRPMIVVTDVRMPFMDGLEMMSRIKAINPYVEFLVLSAYTDFTPVQEALRQGARDYLLKQDISAQQLLEKVKTMRVHIEEQAALALNAMNNQLYELLALPSEKPGDFQTRLQEILRPTGCFPDDMLTAPARVFALEFTQERTGQLPDALIEFDGTSAEFFELLREHWLSAGSGKRRPGSEAPFHSSTAVERALNCINESYGDPTLGARSIAHEVGISYNRLSVLFREETGKTISDYLTEMRIEAAKRLLSSGDYKIYEVAEKVGYRSSQYFSYAFRERTGRSPNRYRKAM